jgi:hypothetical protein
VFVGSRQPPQRWSVAATPNTIFFFKKKKKIKN